jgi:hypothetical protein
MPLGLSDLDQPGPLVVLLAAFCPYELPNYLSSNINMYLFLELQDEPVDSESDNDDSNGNNDDATIPVY